MKKVFLVIVAIFALMVFMPTANATAKPYQPFTTGIVMEIPEDAVIPPYLTPDHLFLAGTVTQKTTEGITLRFFYYEDRNYSYIAYDTDGTPREIPPYMEATIWDGQKFSFVGLQFLSGDIAVNETKELAIETFGIDNLESNKLNGVKTDPATIKVKKILRPKKEQ